MPWAALILSIAGLIGSSIAFARALARPGVDRFWVAIAAAVMQMGVVATVASCFRGYDGGPVLALQVPIVAGAIILARWRRSRPLGPGLRLGAVVGGDWVCAALAIAVVLFLALSGVRQGVTPIWGPDEGMYHGPRIAYWLQHRSIFVYETPNDRQMVFPFGAELIASWPLLFVKAEWLARMAFWLCFPAGAAGVWVVARTIGAGARAAMVGVLLFVSTPTVLNYAESLKSDAWLPVFTLGAAYAALRPRAMDERPGVRFLLSGVFLGLAINVKTTALALLPGLVFAAFLDLEPRRVARGVFGLCAGVLLAAATSGLGLQLGTNMVRTHNLLGPRDLRAIVQPDRSLEQMWAHTVRTPLYLFELPAVPAESVRLWLESRGEDLSQALGAAQRLPTEVPDMFPGIFKVHVPRVAERYSLGGMLWLPALLVGVGRAAWQAARRWRRPALTAEAAFAVLQLPLLLGVVYMVRWMAGGPDRFWLGAYALSVPLTVRLIGGAAQRRPWLAGAVACVIPASAYPILQNHILAVDQAIAHPLTQEAIDYPFQEVIPRIPAGSRVLLFGSGGVREYWLFNPLGGFTNRMFRWGRGRFDAAVADSIVDDNQVTHVVIEHDMGTGVEWNRAIPARPVVSWIAGRKDFREVPLQTPHMRLFERVPSP